MPDVDKVGFKSEDDDILELNAPRIDQRITIKPIESERAGKEKTKVRPSRSRRMLLFIITGKATQPEKDDLEDASRNWWAKGSGGTKGRIRFKWGDNKGDGSVAGAYYDCAIRKADFTEEAAHEKYDYMVELIEGDF